jgi:surfeit locus 1 family protein
MTSQRILILLATLLAFASTTSLGLWQLSRAAQKTQMARQLEERRQLPPIALSGQEDASQAELLVDRPVSLRGQWLSAKTVYLDNRQMEGRPGFWVMTPLKLEGSNVAVMVQRGWVVRNYQDRTSLPNIDTPIGSIQLTGRMATHAAKLLDLGAGDGGQIRQNLDLNAYALEIGEKLLPMVVLQTGPDGDGMKRQWPAVDTGVDKHHGYAFQWFGLSALWVILYVWFQLIIPRKKRASA